MYVCTMMCCSCVKNNTKQCYKLKGLAIKLYSQYIQEVGVVWSVCAMVTNIAVFVVCMYHSHARGHTCYIANRKSIV